jgi:putative ABC transport system permease protein
MFNYYLKIAARSLKKSPFYSFIAIAGLVIGLSACIILLNYAAKEKSYDSFHADKDKIYRVESYFTRNGQITDSWASSSFGYAAAMKSNIPEVQDITRVNNYDCERIVRYKENIYREPRVVTADSNFFQFFSYPLLQGDANEVLKQPNSIVISESAARRYFGQEQPIGKIMHISTLKTKYDCMVTGIFKDFPKNSHLQLDLMISYASTKKWERDYWYMHEAYTYIKTGASDAGTIERKFPAVAEPFKTLPALKEHQWCIHLIPLTDIHLNAHKPYEVEEKGSAGTVQMLLWIALAVLVISWINYINLFISRAMERAGEIGVRKMAGAGYGHIIKQFLTEALLINFIALMLFFLLMLAVIPAARALSLDDIFYGFWQNPNTWQICVLAFVFGTFITGIIPAFVLRTVNTALVLKNKLSFRSGLGNGLRKGLIVFQYFASVVLIICTLTIRKQVQFMQSQSLGIATEQTFVFKTPTKEDKDYDHKMQTLIDGLKQVHGVKQVTQSSAIPGRMVGYGMANRRVGDPDKINKMFETYRVDHEFLPAYQLQLIKGRNFSRSFATDSTEAVILTETAMQLFGFANADEAVNGYVHLEGHDDKRFRVIGVVKDYHQLSLKENFKPILFMMYNPWNWINNHYVSVKLDQSAAASFIGTARNAFTGFFPGSSFDYFFLDDYFNRQYLQDIQYQRMIGFFSWLALFIVVLGIVSMSGFMLLKRRKEIGVRKVMGAGTWQILGLLNVHFIRLLVLAFVVAVPAAWFIMYQWLQNFAYRTDLGLWIPVAAVFVALGVTVLTVSVLSFKAAVEKPVDALRVE